MEATSTHRKSLQLKANGEQLGEIIYRSMFHFTAEIVLANSERYEVTPVGFFGTTITVRKGGMEIANLKMNWRGQIVFAFQDGQEYVFKGIGLFDYKYIIENKEGEKLLQLAPKFNWSKFDYNYDVTYEKEPQDPLFVLLAIYAANYYIAAVSGAS